VHIIEARELKAENMDGTSDPVVYVECFGQKQNTIVVKSVTSCVYDELLIFNMKNLDKETFADGLIRIACYDANAVPFAGTSDISFSCCSKLRLS
jgi:Ca2+-dependent lipid-binding protein